MFPAIFLDRDGVIIENRSRYVRGWDDVAIFGQALTALARIKSSPYQIIIVTNQSAIGRGIISLETALNINHRLLKVINETGGRIDGVFMCPHAPEDHCDCRKPKPGLILQAAESHNLDLSRSILIGDALSDIMAADAAGISHKVLVRTGLGGEQVIDAESEVLWQLRIYDTLERALTELVSS
jgi:D-glycero-D-manno-heptose 1,7-bisphosphate phosphatase